MKVRFVVLISAFFLVIGLSVTAQAGPTPGGVDTDGDTVEDAFDNCTLVSNSNQSDCERKPRSHRLPVLSRSR